MRILIAFLFLVALLPAPALAQTEDQRPAGPRQLWDRFFNLTNNANRASDPDLKQALKIEAGRLFELEDLPPADRDARGSSAAAHLYDYVNRLKADVPTADFPEVSDEPEHVWKSEKGPIIAVRQKDNTWLFSARTRKAIEQYYREVADREATLGGGEFRDATTRLRDVFPLWMRKRAFLLAYWQWVGLALLILAGLVASAITQVLIFFLAARIAARRGVKLERGRKVMRPFGLIATGTIWYLGLHYLLLGEMAYAVLMNAVRLVLMVAVVWSLCRIVDWGAEVFAGVAARTRTKLDDILVPMVRRVIKIVIVILGVVWIAENMGQDVGTLLAGLGIGGVAIALASRDSVENFFGAITILADHPFEVGDWIVMGDIEGTVTRIGFRSTRVRTFYNSLITFPNAMLIRSAVDNLGRRLYRRLKFTLGVTYDTPPEKLEAFVEGIRELIRRHPYTRKDYYHVYFHGYGDNSLNILVYLFLTTPDWGTELRERQRLLMDVLKLAREMEVEFAFPTRTLHMIQQDEPRHTDVPADKVAAWKHGQKAAGAVCEEFDGGTIPPPVRIGQRPDEALDEDGGE
ncbi:MAG: mechanosensitive ion channel family protein [Planctomycetota bacterium]|jgi:MscS family membrane protein